MGATIETMEDILGKRVNRPPLIFYENQSQPLNVQLGFYFESLGNFKSTDMVRFWGLKTRITVV